MNPHKFVKFIEENRSLPISSLADKAGVSNSSIGRWKAGLSPRLIDLESVLEVLGFELVIAKKHRPDFLPEREELLVQEVKQFLNRISPITDNADIAREIVVKIGSAYEGQACLDLTEECVNLSRTISQQREEINRLNARVVEFEYLQPYRNGATKTLRAMSVGDVLDFPAGKQSSKLRKSLWDTANSAKMKIKTKTIEKDGIVFVEVTRVV